MFWFLFDEYNNKISPHTIKKFEIIAEYVTAWAQKLMNFPKCEEVIYIDCMSNSGVYYDAEGNEIEGSPIRVANIISNVMKHYPQKKAHLFFNDWDKKKIEILKSRLPKDSANFCITTSCMDGNDLLKQLAKELPLKINTHYLLVYDPFQATIDWDAVGPFLQTWGEVIINHMVSDSLRAAKVVKRQEKIEKYENTYLSNIEELAAFGSDKDAFEKRIEEIIQSFSGIRGGKYYIASFPFFNSMNSVVYNLIHCTRNIEGFKLYKTAAWKVFGGKSSMKNTHHHEEQLVLQFDESLGNAIITSPTDEYCYYPQDIAKYVQNKFKGRQNVSLNEVWELLDEHPVFPSNGYKSQIKNILKEDFGARVSKSTISFSNRSGLYE